MSYADASRISRRAEASTIFLTENRLMALSLGVAFEVEAHLVIHKRLKKHGDIVQWEHREVIEGKVG